MCSILVVDDERSAREVMVRLAERLGHEVRQAANADEALDRMAERAAGVALCDVAMPGRDGVWLAVQLRQAYPDTAIIMATASQDVDVALSSLRVGAVDFLAKPFGQELLRQALARGVLWHREARRVRERLEALQRDVRDHLAHLEAFFVDTPVASDADLERVFERLIPDRSAAEHAQRVAALATNMAVSMGIRGPELDDIHRAALLHDLGMVATPPAILCKPARLSEDEVAIVRQQPRLVGEILDRNPFLASASNIVRAIFERVDGEGYPWALRGDEIPRGARIVAVANTLDAMTHTRMYREACTLAEAVFEIHRCRGTQFDPEAVDALLSVIRLHWASVTRRPTAEPDSPTAVTDLPTEVPGGTPRAQGVPVRKRTRAGAAPRDPAVDESGRRARSEETASGG
jgi:response regulator RpfG family c-di-GMP phosphodiesterase